MVFPMKVSVQEAKERFDELIDVAQSGKSSVVTRDGETVAEIIPPKTLIEFNLS